MEHRVAVWSFSIFLNTKNAPKYLNFYLETYMEHDQSSYFCRGPDDFCWSSAPVGPTLVTGPPKTNHTETEGLITEITRVRLAAANNI